MAPFDSPPDTPGPAHLALTAEGLRCSYGNFEAVRGIDLSVAAGEFFALLGTNGAGKTTTMETLEGHRPATAGRLRVLGRDPHRERRRLRPRMGIMLQESGFAGELTVDETVRLWLRLSSSEAAKPDRQANTIRDALENLELSSRATTRVQQLSGGQRRRLDLILATVNRPEILFLDEPTTGLDPESRERTWDVVQRLRSERGATVVLTTHYLEEAETMADKVAIMHAGRIAVTGSIAGVLAAQPARIRFRAARKVDPADLCRKAGLSSGTQASTNTQGAYTISTQSLQADLFRLLAWADAEGHTLQRLSATEATLAEVFRSVSALDGDDSLTERRFNGATA